MNEDTPTTEWRQSILSRLEQERPRATTRQEERIQWLVNHLDEYVDRWIGFSEHPVIAEGPVSEAFASGQFALIGLAIELIENEMPEHNISERGAVLWARLLQVYQELRTSHDLEQRSTLRQASGELLAYLNSLD